MIGYELTSRRMVQRFHTFLSTMFWCFFAKWIRSKLPWLMALSIYLVIRLMHKRLKFMLHEIPLKIYVPLLQFSFMKISKSKLNFHLFHWKLGSLKFPNIYSLIFGKISNLQHYLWHQTVLVKLFITQFLKRHIIFP